MPRGKGHRKRYRKNKNPHHGEFVTPFIVYDWRDHDLSMYSEKIQRIALDVLKRAEIRTRCAESQGWRCAYCHRKMTIESGSLQCSFDHVIPVSQGGEDTYENCVAACKHCNGRRGDVDAGIYYEQKNQPNHVEAESGRSRRRRNRKRKNKRRKVDLAKNMIEYAKKIISESGWGEFENWVKTIKQEDTRSKLILEMEKAA